MSEHILTEQVGGVLRIQINRPAKRNALTAEMYTAMADALELGDDDAGVRAILITGTADTFTGGNDLTDFLQSPPSGPDSPVLRFLHAVSHAPKPVVAAVSGAAIGIGTTMLLHCDLVYADETARFQLPFVDLGLCPEAASSYLLPALAGHQRAAELLLLGEPFGAARAHELGLVTRVVEAWELVAVSQAAAERLVAKPAEALRLTKALMKRGTAAAVDDAMAEEGRHFLERLGSPEAKAAFTAFLEKRPPSKE
jgi:enoyl-CoA hydratase/carnithine racemase